MKVAIVSLADSKYFNLLNELVDSIIIHPDSKNIKICILDSGLENQQIEILEKKVFIIKKPNIDFKISRFGFDKKPYLLGIAARLFLREIFPSFDKYIWIDSDAWVSSWLAIDYLIEGSNNKKLAISSMSDRHTGRVLRVNWLFRGLGLIKSQNYKHAISSGYSLKVSRKVGLDPHLNAGVFCLEKNSEFWEVWKSEFFYAVKKGRIFGSDQIALNIAVHILGQPVNILPHYCNWIPRENNTIWDEQKKIFREKYVPHHEIGIIHLAGGVFVNGQDMRFDKSIKVSLETLQNNKIKKSFRFDG